MMPLCFRGSAAMGAWAARQTTGINRDRYGVAGCRLQRPDARPLCRIEYLFVEIDHSRLLLGFRQEPCDVATFQAVARRSFPETTARLLGPAKDFFCHRARRAVPEFFPDVGLAEINPMAL
jgi:hypothetical protein